MIKQYNFIIENRLITVSSENVEEAEILAKQIVKELKQAFYKD